MKCQIKQRKRGKKLKEVEIITANLNVYNKDFVDKVIKKVCAYARVSTDNEEQLTSYSSQIKH